MLARPSESREVSFPQNFDMQKRYTLARVLSRTAIESVNRQTLSAEKIKMVEAARIAWAVILIKTRQLILFDGAGIGIFVVCAKQR